MQVVYGRWRWAAALVVLGVVPLGVVRAQLGNMARVTPLAKQQAEGLSGMALAWSTDRVMLSEPLTHQHELGFVYAEGAAHTVTVGYQATTIEAGKGAAVSTESHTHSPGTFLELRLAAPGAVPQANGTRVFASEILQGIPTGTVTLQFVDVVLPPNGGMTNVHTHPGTETVFARAGSFEYQSGLHGTEPLQVGAVRSLPPDMPVQKRNPAGEEAAFLALFIVDPAKPLATEASFPVVPAAPPPASPAAPALQPGPPASLPDTGSASSVSWTVLVAVVSIFVGAVLLRRGGPNRNTGR